MLKQYNPKKPDKWGFKASVLSESKSGYVLDWTLYAGKTENAAAADDDASVTHRIVRSLMADHIGKGHELYIDSYYTSVPIAVELSTQLSQYIQYSMSSVVGSGTQGSPDVKQLITRTICAIITDTGESSTKVPSNREHWRERCQRHTATSPPCSKRSSGCVWATSCQWHEPVL